MQIKNGLTRMNMQINFFFFFFFFLSSPSKTVSRNRLTSCESNADKKKNVNGWTNLCFAKTRLEESTEKEAKKKGRETDNTLTNKCLVRWELHITGG